MLSALGGITPRALLVTAEGEQLVGTEYNPEQSSATLCRLVKAQNGK